MAFEPDQSAFFGPVCRKNIVMLRNFILSLSQAWVMVKIRPNGPLLLILLYLPLSLPLIK